jgi:glycosyltransferase involved in cell wall biosynthesis
VSAPSISVVIPAYDAEATVADAVASLAGDARIAEVLLVDDASGDATAATAERAAAAHGVPLRVVRLEGAPVGPGGARNAGIAHAQSDILGFLDADDVWRMPVPVGCLAAIDGGATVALAQTQSVQLDEHGQFGPVGEPAHLYGPVAGLVTARALEDVGGFDESLRNGEDLDLLLRLRDAGHDAVLVDEVLLEYRLRPGTASSSRASRQAGFLAALNERARRVAPPITLSVLMPTLNSATFVAAALETITAQVPAPLEIIVIDGGSTDATLDIVRATQGTTVIEQRSVGVHAAHNEGLAAASGDVVAFCGSDDLVRPGAFAHHLTALARHPDAAMSVGLTRLFGDEAGHAASVRPGLLDTVRRARCLEAVAVRRSAVERYGNFREDLGPGADMEWIQRLAADGAVRVDVDAVVVDKRFHMGNLTYADGQRAQGELLGALRASIVRGRAAP